MEVEVFLKGTIQLNLRVDENSKNAIQVQEEQQKTPNINESRKRYDKGLKHHFEVLCSSN